MLISRLLNGAVQFLLVIGLAVTIGCGDGRPTRVPIAGQVLIDGKPLTFGFIRFLPEGARGSAGALDKDGHFTLTCYEPNDGATVGTHRIEVSAKEEITATKFKWHAPQKYASYTTSGLTQEIKGPVDNLVINLSWDGGEPFFEVEQGGGAEDAWAAGKKK